MSLAHTSVWDLGLWIASIQVNMYLQSILFSCLWVLCNEDVPISTCREGVRGKRCGVWECGCEVCVYVLYCMCEGVLGMCVWGQQALSNRVQCNNASQEHMQFERECTDPYRFTLTWWPYAQYANVCGSCEYQTSKASHSLAGQTFAEEKEHLITTD